MAQQVAERLIWAVETLDLEPTDQVLEIGCGHGVAVSLICDKLIDGKITAIDRSASMINMATKRNSQCIASARAQFLNVAPDQADFDDEKFNKVFAFHVNVFWRQPAKELAVIKKALMPGGSLFLFNQPLEASKTKELVAKMTSNLLENGFPKVDTIYKNLKSGSAVCVIAKAQ